MRFRLRTLMIVLALGPPVIALPVIAHQKAAAMHKANKLKHERLGRMEVLSGDRLWRPYPTPQAGEN